MQENDQVLQDALTEGDQASEANQLVGRAAEELARFREFDIRVESLDRRLAKANDALVKGDAESAGRFANEILAHAKALQEIMSISSSVASKLINDKAGPTVSDNAPAQDRTAQFDLIKQFVKSYTAHALGAFLFKNEFTDRVAALSGNGEFSPAESDQVQKIASEKATEVVDEMLESNDLKELVVWLSTDVSKEHHNRLLHSVVGEILSSLSDTIDERIHAYMKKGGIEIPPPVPIEDGRIHNIVVECLSSDEFDKRIRENAIDSLVTFLKSGKIDNLLDEKLAAMKREIELELISNLAASIQEKGPETLREVLRDVTFSNVRDFMSSAEFEALLKEKEGA